ncbi:MAG: hypothetical protein FJ207_06270 [Gemmatimonadetes bacterium]|nr:hypothetical protein [Gemmatimonadota bacterium]
MRRAPRWAAGLCFVWSCLWQGAALHAQAPELLRPGREVRVYVTGVAGVFESALMSASANAVTLRQRDGSIFTLQATQIQRSEVLATKRNTKAGAILGAGVGLGVGIWWPSPPATTASMRAASARVPAKASRSGSSPCPRRLARR